MVEASKASTGNLTLEMTDINFVEMLYQVMGEFEERLADLRFDVNDAFPGYSGHDLCRRQTYVAYS